MIWQLDLFILGLIIVCALASIMVKDLMSAAVIFGAYSFLMCLLWTEMGAVDVAFTEASVGAGVGTVFFIAAVFRTTRHVSRRSEGRLGMKFLGLLGAMMTGLLLLAGVHDFPGWADPNSPASQHVSPYYLTRSIEDTSVPNIVTSVLADYRGFDTMFETTVIFTAGIAVTLILRRKFASEKGTEPSRRSDSAAAGYPDTIIRFVSRQLVPFMQLYALYVIAHGHHSPGGGFQGGVILGASFILLGITYDLKSILARISERKNILLGNLGVLIYSGIGALCLLLGANFLDYSALSKILPGATEITARSHGMLGIEIGVAIAAMAIMVSIYVNVASHGKHDEGL